MTRQLISNTSNHCSVRLTRSVRRRSASFKSACGKSHQIGTENALVLTGVANFRGRQLLSGLFPKLSFPETLGSYVNKAKRDVRAELIASPPRPHFQFLSRCESYFGTNDFVASHSGGNPLCPESREFAEIVLA